MVGATAPGLIALLVLFAGVALLYDAYRRLPVCGGVASSQRAKTSS